MSRYQYDLYIASSWRNEHHASVVTRLRRDGLRVYDYRNPEAGNRGFNWKEIDPNCALWAPNRAVVELGRPGPKAAFALDGAAMLASEACLLLLPSGRSAHLEAGWFAGKGRSLYVLVTESGPTEVPYLLATKTSTTLEGLGLTVDYPEDMPSPDGTVDAESARVARDLRSVRSFGDRR